MADDEPRVFELQTDEIVLSGLERRVLEALPMRMTGGEWAKVVDICDRADDVHPDDVRSCLARLHARYIVERGRDSETFARTPRGKVALKRGVDRPSDYTRFGPSDKAGQPCIGGCGRLAPAPTPAPDGAAGQGWHGNEDGDGFSWALVCPDCCDKPEMIARVRACAHAQDEGED